MSNPYERAELFYWLGYNAFCKDIHEPPKKIARQFYLVREWQRGYDSAYFDNRSKKRLRRFEVQKRRDGCRLGKPFVQTEKAEIAQEVS